MIQVRRSSERGMFENEWLKSFHSFSFDTYYDPKHNYFGPLRVINHDFVKAKNGFGTHPHRDMEIITYVLRGEISHKDSLGNEMKVPAGDIQRMSAGTGIFHSEHNLSDEELELFQIWILQEKKG
ncbi:MAG: pirin family protein, partial [Bdellovibrionales bacterium]|nr:pirin family protein [Bdellovibrionales bacterium]